MTRLLLVSLLVMVSAWPASAQKSAAADKQAGSWFNNSRDSFVNRMGAGMSAGDLDTWEAACKNAGLEASRQDLFFALPKFNPLFDSGGKFVTGAIAKYAKRLEQLPAKSIDEWKALTGGDRLIVAMSLTAENGVFPGEKYSDQGFRALIARFKR